MNQGSAFLLVTNYESTKKRSSSLWPWENEVLRTSLMHIHRAGQLEITNSLETCHIIWLVLQSEAYNRLIRWFQPNVIK